MRRLGLMGLLLGGLVFGRVEPALADHLPTTAPWPATVPRPLMQTPRLPSDPVRPSWMPLTRYGGYGHPSGGYAGGYGDADCDPYFVYGRTTPYCAGEPSPAVASDGPEVRRLVLSAGDGSAPVATVVWRRIGGRGPLELFYLPSTR